MKNKRKIIAGLVTVVTTLLMGCVSFPVYAHAEETDTIISEKDIYQCLDDTESGEAGAFASESGETDSKTAEKDIEPEGFDVEWSLDTDYGEGILTPKGNLTLVDDVSEEASEDLQYMTVKTKAGNVYYMIVDHSGDEDNVYFLNAVDDSDLVALLDDEAQERYRAAANASVGSDDKKTTVTKNTVEEEKKTEANEQTDDSKKETASEKKSSNSGLGTLFIFVILGGGAAAAYYFLKIKPKKNQPQDIEDMEFFDDEEYENEESENEDFEDADSADTDNAEDTDSEE